jgi:hypothetical protein
MYDGVNYPYFVEKAMERGISEERALEADERLHELKGMTLDDKIAFQRGEITKTWDEIKFEDKARVQAFWEDLFGDDSWDDRHIIYPYNE